MKKQGFCKIEERTSGDIFWNGFPVEKLGGNKLKINEDVYNKSDDLQNVFTKTSNIPLKKLNDKDKEMNKNISESLDFKIYKPLRDETKSAKYKYSKTNFKDLEGQGIEKIIIPSNINDIYTRLLGLKLSGHTNTLT